MTATTGSKEGRELINPCYPRQEINHLDCLSVQASQAQFTLLSTRKEQTKTCCAAPGGALGVVGGRAALGEALDTALASLARLFTALDTGRQGVLVPAKVRAV